MSKYEYDILQIIPAGDWRAVYKDDDGTRYTNRIAAIALVKYRDQRIGYDLIGVGLSSDGGPIDASDASNFDGYHYGPLAGED